jgi:octaprenyl-diphosphate synthase
MENMDLSGCGEEEKTGCKADGGPERDTVLQYASATVSGLKASDGLLSFAGPGKNEVHRVPRREPLPAAPESPECCASNDMILSTMPVPCPELRPVIEFAMGNPGKRLRSTLLILAARTLSHRPEHLAEAATLVELLHNGTLLHDDVMDHARVRRHRPTVNRLWGDPVAILAGDFLLAAVMDLALRTGQASVLRLAVDTLMQLASGQMQEIRNQGNLSLGEEEYLEIVRRKTGALFAASCKLGGLIARGNAQQTRALETFGRELGQAFQLIDDLQDYLSEQQRTGKEPGRDLAEAKVTLPLICAFRNADPEQQRKIRHLFSKRNRHHHLQEFRSLIQDLGGFSRTFSRARTCIHRAIGSLSVIPAGQANTRLAQCARDLLGGDGA